VTNTVFKIKRKPNWFVLISTGVWSIGWLALIGTILFGILSDLDKIDGELMIFTSLFVLAGLLVSRVFLWHLRGYELVRLTDNELVIEKKGTFLSLPRRFELINIEYVSNTEKPTTPKWLKFWGLSGGKIELVYLGQTKYFGQTIDFAKAYEIIEEIKKKIKTRHANNGYKNIGRTVFSARLLHLTSLVSCGQ
jgi:hypothetical protein